MRQVLYRSATRQSRSVERYNKVKRAWVLWPGITASG